MTPSILAIALAYAFLLFALLLALLRSEIGAGIKLAVAALCCGFYLWHYDALQNYLGWPADNELPRQFELIQSFSVEPDIKRDQPGGIYLWLMDLNSEQPVPRAYRLPYRKDLHRKIDDTLQKQRQGQRHVGTPVAGGAGKNTDIQFEAVERDTRAHKAGSD